jgi:LPXTG-motif cell wall-anchored protein
MVRTNQGGSVLSFVIIGAIMAAILVGGVYIVHQQTRQPAGETPQEVVEEPPATPPVESEKEAEKPQKEETPQTTPQTEKEVELPQTGPAESLMTLVAVALLGFTATSYLRSRRIGLSL